MSSKLPPPPVIVGPGPVALTWRAWSGRGPIERVEVSAYKIPTDAPDPSTHQYCTLSGMIGNNSCGVH